jgi:N-acetylmuramate 1-kinase
VTAFMKTSTKDRIPARLLSVLNGIDHEGVEKLQGDASTREYYRIRLAYGNTRLAMVMPTPGAQDEEGFLEIRRFLDDLGLPVPEVYQHYPAEGIVLLQDLGDMLLETALQDAPEDLARDLYTKATDILIEMRRATEGLSSGCGAFQLAFDEAKLTQELEFFLEHFVKGMLKLRPSVAALKEMREFFSYVSVFLAEQPRVFTHRDYHSRNLILFSGDLFMIDFQDARMGPAQYDLASLLRDSYFRVPDSLVDLLLDRYMDGTGVSEINKSQFLYTFDVMSLQRNIKALGTFGYQAAVRGTNRYISAIPRTGRYIQRNLEAHDGFAKFRAVLQDYIVGPALDCGN